jgi:hypothetical protein
MKELSENLRRWFKEKWTAQDGSDCGSYEGKGEVKCRPSKRVSSKTAKTWGEMSKDEKKKAVRLKQKAHKKGHQFSSHKTGKTWKGKKYKGKHTAKKKKLREGVEVDEKFLKNFMLDAIKDPRKFYYLLLLSGMKSNEAYRLIYNLKNPKLTTTSLQTRMRMLGLLQNIIELITTDRILYSRLRSLAMSGELQHLGKTIFPKSVYSRKPNKMLEDTSISAGGIAPIAPPDPSSMPAPLAKPRNIGLLARIEKMLKRKGKGPTDPNVFAVIHGG